MSISCLVDPITWGEHVDRMVEDSPFLGALAVCLCTAAMWARRQGVGVVDSTICHALVPSSSSSSCVKPPRCSHVFFDSTQYPFLRSTSTSPVYDPFGHGLTSVWADSKATFLRRAAFPTLQLLASVSFEYSCMVSLLSIESFLDARLAVETCTARSASLPLSSMRNFERAS